MSSDDAYFRALTSDAYSGVRETMDDQFDWCGVHTIIHHQPRTSVYWNPRQQVVIRQDAGDYGQDDAWIYFNIENVPALIEALQSRLVECGFVTESVTAKTKTPGRDATGASRSRRYRDRLKNRDERDGATAANAPSPLPITDAGIAHCAGNSRQLLFPFACGTSNKLATRPPLLAG
jgi:hypothetical protein